MLAGTRMVHFNKNLNDTLQPQGQNLKWFIWVRRKICYTFKNLDEMKCSCLNPSDSEAKSNTVFILKLLIDWSKSSSPFFWGHDGNEKRNGIHVTGIGKFLGLVFFEFCFIYELIRLLSSLFSWLVYELLKCKIDC